MTVGEYAKASFAANNDTVDFAFTFEYFATSEVVVTVRDEDGAETTLTDADYDITTTGGSPYTGGSVETGETYDTGNTIVISRLLTRTQATDLTAGGTLPADTLENQYDRDQMQLQDIWEVLSRCLKYPITDASNISSVLDPSATRASSYSMFDSNGAPSVATGVISASDVTLSDFMEGIMLSGSASSLQTAIGLLDEDAMGSNSALYPVSQQSLVAYLGSAGLTFTTPTIAGYTMTGTGTIANGSTLTTPILITPAINTSVEGSAFLDEDNMASDSAIKLASQQSIKAYRDTPRTGSVVQVVYDYVQTKIFEETISIISLNDDIPQNTEGDEVMSKAIIPTSATNLLKIDVVVMVSHTNTGVIVALFQDSTANTLAAAASRTPNTSNVTTIFFTHYMLAGTASSTTFKVRIGGAGAGSVTLNAYSADNQLFGGKAASSLTITEIQV